MNEHTNKIKPRELEELDAFVTSYNGVLSAALVRWIRETVIELPASCRPIMAMHTLVKLAEAEHKDQRACVGEPHDYLARAAGLVSKYWFLVSGRLASDAESIVQVHCCHDEAEAIAAHKLLVLEDIVVDAARVTKESLEVLIDWVYMSRSEITQIANTHGQAT